jgi:hypothetical protein
MFGWVAAMAWGRRILGEKSEIQWHNKEDRVCKKGEEMAVASRNDLGFGLIPLFTEKQMKGTLNNPFTFTMNFRVSWLNEH